MDFSDYWVIDTDQMNRNMRVYAYLLKLYINSRYNVKFDDVKGTYSKYEFISGSYQLVKCGSQCKLPRPTTIEGGVKSFL